MTRSIDNRRMGGSAYTYSCIPGLSLTPYAKASASMAHSVRIRFMARTKTEISLWDNKQFISLASARMISVLGNSFAQIALGFAVLGLPGSGPLELSVVQGCLVLPQVVFILPGGVIADKLPRPLIMVLSDISAATAYLTVSSLILIRHSPLIVMCLLSLMAGTASALFAPAMSGVLPCLVPTAMLQRATGLLRVGTNSSLLLGFALAGIVVSWLGPGWALFFDGVSFAISALLTAGIRHTKEPVPSRTIFVDLKEGWSEFSSRQWLWVVVTQYAFVVAAVNSNAGVLGPLAAKQYLGGARPWSFLVGAKALGTISGAGIAASIRVRRPILVAVLATFPAALPIALLGLHASLLALVCTMFIAGLASDIFGVLWTTTMQSEVPEKALSRVSAYDWFSSLLLAPVGLMLAGPIANAVGVEPTLLGCALIIVTATSAALLSPEVRKKGISQTE